MLVHPRLSDPGRILINECIKNKIEIFPIPVTIMRQQLQFLYLGFQISSFFMVFCPEKSLQIEKLYPKSFKVIIVRIIFFISPKKLKKITSKVLKNIFQ